MKAIDKEMLLEAMLLHMSAIKDPYELKLLYDRICDNEFDCEPAPALSIPEIHAHILRNWGREDQIRIAKHILGDECQPCVQQSAKNETQDHLPDVRKMVDSLCDAEGCFCKAEVHLCNECFDKINHVVKMPKGGA